MTQIRVLCKDRSVLASVRASDVPERFEAKESDKLCLTAYHRSASEFLRLVEVKHRRPDGTSETTKEKRPDKNVILSLLGRAE